MGRQSPNNLKNPISLPTGEDRQDFTRDDLIQVIERKQRENISFLYPVVDGKLKQLRMPITRRHQTELILAEQGRVDGACLFNLFKRIVDVTLCDLYVVPLYKTAFINPLKSLPALPKRCAELSRTLLKKTQLYERASIFPLMISNISVIF